MSERTRSQVYTRTGDTGKTSTIVEKKVSKGNLLFDVIGTLDEINTLLGVVRTHLEKNSNDMNAIETIQNYLFDLGGELATYKINHNWKYRIENVEKMIDEIDKENLKLNKFILPGGTIESAFLHQARATCRRGERLFWKWIEEQEETSKLSKEDFDSLILAGQFINRLSDLLFVKARYLNNRGENDIPWNQGIK